MAPGPACLSHRVKRKSLNMLDVSLRPTKLRSGSTGNAEMTKGGRVAMENAGVCSGCTRFLQRPQRTGVRGQGGRCRRPGRADFSRSVSSLKEKEQPQHRGSWVPPMDRRHAGLEQGSCTSPTQPDTLCSHCHLAPTVCTWLFRVPLLKQEDKVNERE